MRYAEFLKMAKALKPEEAGDYTKLLPWAGLDRVSIDVIIPDAENPENSLIKITCKHIILKTIRLKYFRTGDTDEVYLHSDIYERYDPEFRQQRHRAKRAEIEQELVDHKRAFIDAEGESSIPTRSPEPPLPDIDPLTATGKDLRMIMDHNQWLREQERGDEEIIPF